jgi:hypothetical protein
VRVVLDADVLLAAYASRGLCEGLLVACIQDHQIISSEHILSELVVHLQGKLRMPASDADQ